MPLKQINDVLEWSVLFHHKLSELYDKNASEADQNELHILLLYLTQHEARLADAVKACELNADLTILSTWIHEYSSQKLNTDIRDLQNSLNCADSLQVIMLTIAFHDQLIELYKHLMERAESDDIKALFAGLVSLEESAEIRMVREAGKLYHSRAR